MSETKRTMIATIAMLQYGAHYLKGARGGIPGGPKVLDRLVELVHDPKYDTLRINTARNSMQTCYGRWDRCGGSLLPAQKSVSDRVHKYISDNEGTPDDSWPPLAHPPGKPAKFYPRRLKGAGSSIANAEDCRNIRHFDCVGFAQWVLFQVQPARTWAMDIPQFETHTDLFTPMGLLPAAETKYGDIVTRTTSTPSHIGFIGFANKVVHASIESAGVIYSDYDPKDWTGLTRVKDAYL